MDSQPHLTERQTDALARARLALIDDRGSAAPDNVRADMLRAALRYVVDAFTPGGVNHDHA
jgi:hypothetical protein